MQSPNTNINLPNPDFMLLKEAPELLFLLSLQKAIVRIEVISLITELETTEPENLLIDALKEVVKLLVTDAETVQV